MVIISNQNSDDFRDVRENRRRREAAIHLPAQVSGGVTGVTCSAFGETSHLEMLIVLRETHSNAEIDS